MNKSDFIPVFRFAACSDTHLSRRNTRESERFIKMFDTMYEYAGKHPTYKTVDALIIAGDISNCGREDEYEVIKSLIKEKIRPETTFIPVMGNHDVNGGHDTYRRCFDSVTDKHVTVKGYHFIGLSPFSGNEDFSGEQMKWLGESLAQAKADDADKPIFVFQHFHITDTVYVSRSWNTVSSDDMRAVMKDYPQIFDFSGHSHGPINNPISIWQDDFTSLGTGTLSFFEMEQGMTGSTVPEGSKNAAQYYIIEVDAENRVLIQMFNILTNDFFRIPTNIPGENRQLYYIIENIKDKSTFAYTSARKYTDGAPWFADDAKLDAYDVREYGVTVSAPQAMDNVCVYGYRFEAADKDGNSVNAKIYSGYYFEPYPERISYTLNGLEPKTHYTLSVYPFNIWGKEGKPIRAEITTQEEIPVIYRSAHPVTFKGTFADFESFDSLSPEDLRGDVVGGVRPGDVSVRIVEGKGWRGSKAIAVTKLNPPCSNREFIVCANENNALTTDYPRFRYLRMWADFTDVEFRKACMGILTSSGSLYTTDDSDGRTDQEFYYMPDGSDTWTTYIHGTDGCFGAGQDCPVHGLKGWFAFPVNDMGEKRGNSTFCTNSVKGIFMYFDFREAGICGREFYLDELSLVYDYRKFEEYNEE